MSNPFPTQFTPCDAPLSSPPLKAVQITDTHHAIRCVHTLLSTYVMANRVGLRIRLVALDLPRREQRRLELMLLDDAVAWSG